MLFVCDVCLVRVLIVVFGVVVGVYFLGDCFCEMFVWVVLIMYIVIVVILVSVFCLIEI